MADGSVEFFVALLGEMKIKAANATEYAERLAADRTYDQRRELLARASHRPDDSNRLRAAALRDRAHKQGDRAAGLYFAANNGHILDEARDVERARSLGLEGVLNEALMNLHAAFSNGERVQVDLHLSLIHI